MPLVSQHSGPLAVACPKCGVGQGERCRTLTTNRSTDIHEARWHAWFKWRVANTPVGGKDDSDQQAQRG